MSLSSSCDVLGRWVSVWESFSDVYGWILGTWFKLKSFRTWKWYLWFWRKNLVLQQSFFIYKEGVGMDRWGNESGLVRNYKWSEACLRMRFWGFKMACADLVYFTNQLVLVLSIKQVQPEALEWPAMHLAFNHFGIFLEFANGPSFAIYELLASKLTFNCVL